MNKGFWLGFWILAILVASLGAVAQQPTPSPSQTDPESETSRDDILILVNLKAKELRFEAVPNTSVEFPGNPARTTWWVTQRQNLPDKVEPGVTYRDIGIQLRISSRFEDIDRIVREALGEAPVEGKPADTSRTEDAAPASGASTSPPEIARKPPPQRQPRRRSQRR